MTHTTKEKAAQPRSAEPAAQPKSSEKAAAPEAQGARKTDRRILRTRRMLRDALLSLMQEKDFSEISARDITDRADLNRGTFYLHYDSTEQLLESIYIDVLNDIEQTIDVFQPQQKQESLRRIVDHIVNYIEESRTLFRCLLLNIQSDAMVRGMAHILQEKGLQVRSQLSIDASTQKLLYASYFITYGIVGIIRQWFRRDCDLSREQLQSYIYQFVAPLIDQENAASPAVLA